MTAPSLFATKTVCAVDLPGHGQAPTETGRGSVAEFATAVAAAARNVIEAPFAVLGDSLRRFCEMKFPFMRNKPLKRGFEGCAFHAEVEFPRTHDQQSLG
jgi:hypothetical protein